MNRITIIAGVDEAGRGPVIGPLVICAFAIEQEKEKELKKIGVKDSKLLSESQREGLFKKLIHLGKYEVEVIDAQELTELMNKKISLIETEFDNYRILSQQYYRDYYTILQTKERSKYLDPERQEWLYP